MALYHTNTMTTMAAFLADLAAFGAANGWTVSVSTTTETTMTKDGATLTGWQYNSTGINMQVTVGGVASPTIRFSYLAAGNAYYLVSCGSSLYIGREQYFSFAGLGKITEKIGTWAGGHVLTGSDSSAVGAFFHDTRSPQYRSLFFNGNWTTTGTTAAAGRPIGSIGADPVVQSPNRYNAAIVPVPVLMAAYNSNTSYYHPLGYVDNVFRAGGNNLYSTGDIITIGDEPYVCFPNMSLLFKLA